MDTPIGSQKRSDLLKRVQQVEKRHEDERPAGGEGLALMEEMRNATEQLRVATLAARQASVELHEAVLEARQASAEFRKGLRDLLAGRAVRPG